jgi:hypothetical protein
MVGSAMLEIAEHTVEKKNPTGRRAQHFRTFNGENAKEFKLPNKQIAKRTSAMTAS